MKKIIDFVLALAVAVGLYVPCRELAIIERGYTDAIGGEALVPVAVLIVWVVVKDWLCKKEER